jgi:hypothetical protein
MLEIAEPAAAIGLLDRETQQAQRAEPGPEIAGERVRAVDFGGARGDLRFGEAGDGLADGVRRLAETEVEGGAAEGDDGRAPECEAIVLWRHAPVAAKREPDGGAVVGRRVTSRGHPRDKSARRDDSRLGRAVARRADGSRARMFFDEGRCFVLIFFLFPVFRLFVAASSGKIANKVSAIFLEDG